MMDSLDYTNMQLSKIEKYRSVGITYGDNLFFTFETYERPLSKGMIDDFIKNVILSQWVFQQYYVFLSIC